MPYFSVVIPCFNAEATLQDTLDSILGQTFKDIEVICIDDGSSDGTASILKAALRRDARVRVARNLGKGPSAARNMGALTLAAGKVIAFCDADDLWAPGKLSELHSLFHTSPCDAAYSKVAFFQNDPSDAKTVSSVPGAPLTVATLLGENPVITMSNLAIKKEAFAATGGFNAEMVHAEDLEWLIRLVASGAKLSGLRKVLTYYRASQTGLSADLEAMDAGHRMALATARSLGFQSSGRDHAIHLRYLARRALRMGAERGAALRFALRGLSHSPMGFFSSPRRGALTLAGALAASVLPTGARRALFSR